MEHDKAVIINEGVVDTRKWTEADCLKVEELLRKVSGKYTLHLLAILALYGEKSFGQLRKEMHPISTKVLYQCLTQLKEHGLIANRREMEGRVAKSYYTITDREKFRPVLLGLRDYA